jgi:plastocyanin
MNFFQNQKTALFSAFFLLAPALGFSLWAGSIEGTVTVTAPARPDLQAQNPAPADDNSNQNQYGENDNYGSAPAAPQTQAAPQPEEIVVYLEKVHGHWKVPKTHPTLDQKYIKFSHRVLPVLVGTTVDFTNHDPVYHNIFCNATINPAFDLGQCKTGETKSITFKKVEVPVNLYCEVHRYMQSNVLVLQNPFYQVVAPGGHFHFTNVPAGTYTLVAWHDYWQPVSGKVKVRKGKTAVVNITLDQVRK